MMVRKQIYIKRHQDREIKRLAHKDGRTEAEILREALDRHVEENKRQQNLTKAWQKEKEFIQQWIAKGPVPGTGKRWRREDLYDRKCLTGR